MNCEEPSSPAPATNPPFSSLLRDISNFKTPRRPSVNPNFMNTPGSQFFTASKQTPKSTSSFRRPSSSVRSKAEVVTARRLKAFEMEQSRSSRKAEAKKEQILRSLAKSLTVWLNFLFENPRSCGCDPPKIDDYGGSHLVGTVKGKRCSDEALIRGAVRVDATWRSPKRLRDSGWHGEERTDSALSLMGSKYSTLRESLKDVCSLDDLKQRLRVYLSLGSCKEIFDVMARVTKNIDEGRIQMKPHCPIVSDVGMKEKAIRTLLCYNPLWLRIGLYIIIGGDSLTSEVDVSSHKEAAFLKMVIEKQFFSHAGLAKAYAYNRMVEGLYRPGYYEALGTVILKRILLLVLILDRAKSQSSLSLKYGLDGTDGGSPLLFSVKSSIKSSHQVINDFLSSDIMFGEGNLLAHLVILGYKIPYQQSALVEYDFRVTDLFVDLQDGVRLCRAIQLLLREPSILMKTVVPSDNQKKNLANCGIALQYLNKAGVPLKDEEGLIIGDDITNGDKELTLSLLWNMFVHLQLPLLIKKRVILEEINKVRGLDVDEQYNNSGSPSEMLLNWIQAICEKYDLKIQSFASLVDGKGIWCLLDYYFCREICCSCLRNEDPSATGVPRSVVSNTDYTDAVHNFILSQKLTALLGNFPEVLQVGDLLENKAAISDRGVMILLAFLSSKLTDKENMDQLNFHKLLCSNCQVPERRHALISFGSSGSAVNVEEGDEDCTEDVATRFKAIKAWWQEMANQNHNSVMGTANSAPQHFSTRKFNTDIQREKAAEAIQSSFRGFLDRRKFTKTMNAVRFLQTVIRAWLSAKKIQVLGKFGFHGHSSDRWLKSEKYLRYVKFIAKRHHFLKLRKSVLLIQRAARTWMAERHERSISIINQLSNNHRSKFMLALQAEKGSVVGQEKDPTHLKLEAAHKIQQAWRVFQRYKHENMSAIIIQSYVRGFIARREAYRFKSLIILIKRYCRGWLVRRQFLLQREAAVMIQKAIRCFCCLRSFHEYKHAAVEVQRLVRGQIARSRLLGASHVHASINNAASRFSCHNYEMKIVLASIVRLQRWWRSITLLQSKRKSAVVIQNHIRGLMARRKVAKERHQIFIIQREAAIRIQNAIRCFHCPRSFIQYKQAAIVIQGFVRGQIVRSRLLGASNVENYETKIMRASVVKLQRWWRSVMTLQSKTKSAIAIQKHIRGFVARRKAAKERRQIVMIQSHWKGYLTRKESRAQLMDLRLRMQASAANVDDNKRLINRLLSALSELLNMKSVRNILHVCETLDTATKYSEKCCEELVVAGAIDKLLTVIRSASRSIPDQEVAKHALSTLRNLARYPSLTEELINSNGSIQAIFWELLRNKEGGYFIASEVLKKICANRKGVEAVRRLPALLKRLHALVEELSRKATIEKRNGRGLYARENSERRLKEAAELLKQITNF